MKSAFYETFKRTDKSDDYVYRAIQYNIFKHRAINRLTSGGLNRYSIIELILMWLEGWYIVEIPDKEMAFSTVITMRHSLDNMVINFTPFDPLPRNCYICNDWKNSKS